MTALRGQVSNQRIPKFRQKCAPAIRQWCGGEHSTEEAEDENGSRVLRERASDLEARVRSEADQEHRLSSVLLRERTPEKRSDAVAGDKERDGQSGNFGAEGELRH